LTATVADMSAMFTVAGRYFGMMTLPRSGVYVLVPWNAGVLSAGSMVSPLMVYQSPAVSGPGNVRPGDGHGHSSVEKP